MLAPRVWLAAVLVGGAVGLAVAAAVPSGREIVGLGVLSVVLLAVVLVAAPAHGRVPTLLVAAAAAIVVAAFSAIVMAAG